MDKILNPSCSELVAMLNVTEIEDIRNTLKEIEKISNYIVGFINQDYKMSTTPLNVKHAKKYFTEIYKVDIDMIETGKNSFNDLSLGIRANQIDNRIIKKSIQSYYQQNVLLPIYLIDKKSYAHLGIDIHDGYCGEKALFFKAEGHYATRDFPLLAKIIDYYDAEYHAHDGGSTDDFNEWCEQNNMRGISRNEGY